MEELIERFDAMFPATVNGFIVLHFDKETRDLKSISPCVPVDNLGELIGKLGAVENAIHHLRDSLVNSTINPN